MGGWKGHGLVFLGAALVAGLPGCGGSGSSGPTVVITPTPVPCNRSTLLQGSFSLPENTGDFETITTTTTGRLDLTLDWTFPSSDMGLFVSQGPCDLDQLKAGACSLLLQLISPPKPLKGSIASLAAGTYGVIIANVNSVPEAVSASVVLSSSTCPAASSFTSQSVDSVGEFFSGILRGFRKGLNHP